MLRYKLIYVLVFCCAVLSSHRSLGKPFYRRSASSFSPIFDKLAGYLERRLSSGSCEACKLISDAIQVIFATNTPEEEVTHVITELCTHFKVEDKRVCVDIVKLFSPEVLTVFDRVILSSDEICGTIIGPSCGHVKKDVFWNITLPKTPKPPVRPIRPPKVSWALFLTFLYCFNIMWFECQYHVIWKCNVIWLSIIIIITSRLKGSHRFGGNQC